MAKGQKRSTREIRKPRQPKQAILAAGSAMPFRAVGPSARQM